MAGLDADVAVVGAGPAGAAAALFAAQSGRRVVVFDRAAFPRDKPCGEGLMPPGPRILAELGLHDAILGTGAPRIDGVVIAAAGQVTEPSAFPRGETGLGVRRLRFDAELGLHDAILGTGAPRIDGVVIAAAGQVTEPSAFPRGETGLGVRRLRFDD